MKKWTWILLALSVGVILFLWTIRENFQDTPTLRGPPYGDSDYPNIVNMMSSELITKLQDQYISESPGQNRPDKTTLEGQRKLVDGTISNLMGDFHTTVYKPASTQITEANVDTFLETKATSGFLLQNKAEIKKLLVEYFVKQLAGAVNTPLTAAQIASNARAENSGYSDILSNLGQTSSSGGTTVDVTTSGNSGVVSASSSRNIKKGNILGPTYTGMGDNAGLGGSGLNGSGEYPTLIGPKPSLSKMVEGGGITAISQNESLVKSGVLPDPMSTGSDPNSQFFGTSRVPGDKDLFPNPYQEFTPSTGSSKTEPVPYLADFSAFLN